MAYTFNQHYFDEVNSAEKAYWLGFIWGDGSVVSRPRGNYIEYSFKISLAETDESHLENFKTCIESTHPIKRYKITGFETQNEESRFYICNKHFARTLHDKYGIVVGRDDFSKVIEHTPEEFYPDLIRGLIDSDGTIPIKDIHYQTAIRKEFSIGLISNESVLNFVNIQLINNGLTRTIYAQNKRHKGADGLVSNIRITGNNVASSILSWLYEGKECISLPRKYKRYEEIRDYMIAYREEKKHETI